MKIDLKNDLDDEKVYYLNNVIGISCENDNDPQTMGLVQFLKLNKNVPIKEMRSELGKGKDFIRLITPHIEGHINIEINFDLLGEYSLGTIHRDGKNNGSIHTQKREITINTYTDELVSQKINLKELHIQNLHVFEVKLGNITYLFPYHVFHQHYLMISNFITKWIHAPPAKDKVDQIFKFVHDYKDEHGELKDVIKLSKHMSDHHHYFAAELYFYPEILKQYNQIYRKRLQYRKRHNTSHEEKYRSPYYYPKFTFPRDGEYDLTIFGYPFYHPNNGHLFMVTEITKSSSDLIIPPYNYVPGLPKPRNAGPNEKLDKNNFRYKKVESEESKTLDTSIRPSSDLSSLLLDSRNQTRTYRKPPKVSKVIPKQTSRGSTVTGIEKEHGATGFSTTTNQKAHELKHHTKNNLNHATTPKKPKKIKKITRIDKSERFDFMDKTLAHLYTMFKKRNVHCAPDYAYYNLENNRERYNRVIYYPNSKNRQVMVAKLRLNKKFSVYLFEIDILKSEKEGNIEVTIPEEIRNNRTYVIDETKLLKSPMRAPTLLVFDKGSKFKATDITVFLDMFVENNGSWDVDQYTKNPTANFNICTVSRKTNNHDARARTLFNKIKENLPILGKKDRIKATSLSDQDKAHDQNKNQRVA